MTRGVRIAVRTVRSRRARTRRSAGTRRAARRPARSWQVRCLTLLAVVALLAGLLNGQAVAQTTSTPPSTPVQQSGTAAGKSHRAPAVVRQGKAPAGPTARAVAVSPPPAATPHLSNQLTSATPPSDPARITSRPAVASGQEDVGLRTATRSVFDNPDGTQTARIYTQPVHFKTSSGA